MTDARESLERAIAAQEALRGVVPDDVVDAAVAALTRQLAAEDPGSSTKRRTVVTVLFADIAGFTSLGEDLDPEDLSDTFDQVWDRIDRVITERNGRIEKHIGDAVMGVWGAAEVREDDAEQAIRAGLAIQRVLAALSAEVGMPQLRMRVGINTGPAVIGAIASTGEMAAMGDAVNVASRLEKVAPVGGIRISHDTYRHVRGLFSVREQEPIAVKGRVGAVKTYLVNSELPRAFRLRTRGIEGVETRMVGRDHQLHQLQDAFDATVREDTLRLVTVEGDAGIGKSRLLYGFEDWLLMQPNEFQLFHARADQQYERVPYALARDLLLSAFDIADHDPPEATSDALRASVVGLLGEGRGEEASFIGHLVGVGSSDDGRAGGIGDDARQLKERGLRAITLLFDAMARDRPTVVLLEDLHWADRASLELIDHLAEHTDRGPLLIVGAGRPALREWYPGWGTSNDLHQWIVLAPLTTQDSRTLVREVLQRVPDLPDVVLARITSDAAGNPFYLEELVRVVIEDGVIVTGEDEWLVRPERLRDLRVPPTLVGVLRARLDRLPVDERDTLCRAAVVGQLFWDQAIPRPAGSDASVGHAPMASALDSLGSKDLVLRQEDTAFAGTREYRFQHALLHDVVYDTLLKQERQHFHRAVAEWLTTRPEAGVHAAAIARHFERAGLPSDAAGWYGRAAQQAQARYANDDAIACYHLALRPGLLEPEACIPLCEGLAETLMLQAHYDESHDAATAMLDAARAAADPQSEALALVLLATTLGRQGRAREALATAEEAHRGLQSQPDPDPAMVMTVLTEIGWHHLRLGEATAAIDRAEQALARGGAADHPRELRQALSLLGSAHMALGHYETAAASLEQGLALDRARGDRRGEVASLINLGETARLQGDDDAARSLYERALAGAQEMGDRDQEALVLSNLGGVLVDLGQHQAAVAFLQEAIAAFDAAGASEHVSETHRFLAEAYLGMGQTGDALAEARRALLDAGRGENPDHAGNAWRVLGQIAANLGRPITVEGDAVAHGAGDCLARSAAVFAESGMERDRACALWEHARIERGQGNDVAADLLWTEARDTFRRLDLPLLVARMDRDATTE